MRPYRSHEGIRSHEVLNEGSSCEGGGQPYSVQLDPEEIPSQVAGADNLTKYVLRLTKVDQMLTTYVTTHDIHLDFSRNVVFSEYTTQRQRHGERVWGALFERLFG